MRLGKTSKSLMTNNLVWRLLVSYNVRDYPDFRPDEIINEALNEGAIDGGSGMGFGFRDHDATFETKEEVIDTIYDLKEAKVDVVTIGQYLQPSKKHLQVQRFVTPDEFLEYKELGEKLGFKHFEI